MSDRTTAYDATRDTRFRIILIQQGPNGYGLVCADRTAPGSSPPPLEISEDDLTPEQHEAAIALFAAFERAYERRFLGYAAAPERVTEAVTKAVEAERKAKVAELEAQRLDMLAVEKAARLAEIEERIAKAHATEMPGTKEP